MAVGRNALGWLLVVCPSSVALNPDLDISQYAHHAWSTRDGAFRGRIGSIAQTPDGYLWLGTEFGLLRFDGNRFVPWQPPNTRGLSIREVSPLLVSRDGRLWIGTNNGIASWNNSNLTSYAETAAIKVGDILEDREGIVWVSGQAGLSGRLCAIRGSSVRCFGEDGCLGRVVRGLGEYGGFVWAGAINGLWRWQPGPPRLYTMPASPEAMSSEGSRLIVGTNKGLFQLAGEKLEPYPIATVPKQFFATHLLRDRDGGIWIGTEDRGLLHVHEGRTDVFGRPDGLSSDFVERLFEDREGNIWAATQEGVDRFRAIAVSTVSVKQGLSANVGSVLSDRDRSVWLGTVSGLDHWINGRIAVLRKGDGLSDDSIDSLFQDDRGHIFASTPAGVSRFEGGRFAPLAGVAAGFVWSMAGSAADLWISSVDHGLLHLQEGKPVEQIPWATLGRKDFASVLLHDPSGSGLWLGFLQGGIAYLKDGKAREYTEADGLAPGRITHLRIDGDGVLWTAAAGGLSRVKSGHIATLTRKNGLPCDSVHWAMEDDDHFLWLYMACGLVRIPRAEIDAWEENPNHPIQNTMLDASDGVSLHAFPPSGYSPSVAKAADGRLWFTVGGGVSILDPRHLSVNTLPPPVHIESIKADDKDYDLKSSIYMPALTRDLEIEYTALSFVAPEKVYFKVKLEGQDRDWREMGADRHVHYSNLKPRSYRFRVMASNNSGVWNEAGDSLEFSVAPAYYQTSWFWSSVAAAFLALLWGLHRYRLRQVAKEFNARLEGRVSERTRVARDLHDTLLQSFQGVLLKFSAIQYIMRSRPDEAEEELERTLDQARAAISEGRDAVQGLRSSTVVANDLARAITSFGERLAADHAGPNCPEFRVFVEGKSRDLPPLVRDEVFKISCECLRNAFLHAEARRIEAHIRYDQRQFQLKIADNGKGIDAAVLSAGGRAGHHGLPGIHERAEVAGGKLSVWSKLGSGTEIELTIPGSIAYTKPPRTDRTMSSGRAAG